MLSHGQSESSCLWACHCGMETIFCLSVTQQATIIHFHFPYELVVPCRQPIPTQLPSEYIHLWWNASTPNILPKFPCGFLNLVCLKINIKIISTSHWEHSCFLRVPCNEILWLPRKELYFCNGIRVYQIEISGQLVKESWPVISSRSETHRKRHRLCLDVTWRECSRGIQGSL